ncbi:hypothetical protein GMD78_12370 [Ornithinibacillus sp. L9]|uniref:DUF3037 domain-containing protein n=1 Tax=Ornithinibacillus caprae TaxID=2678566 RepID=A0A6N8FP03_9BACI|nr:hypothetical protein [Ornithinibacillus caprae]MUK89168.1 hypothetical protein [Ornithinibacillus caprae]
MEKRKASWYSIVRYRADDLAGEVVNVGVLLHSLDGEGNALSKYLLVNENSPKIRAVTQSETDVQIYKTYKEVLEYYLDESSNNLFGTVGDVQIGSPSQNDFLEKIYDHYIDKKMFLTRPKFSLSGNLEGLFKSLFCTYIGEKFLNLDQNHISTKKHMKKLLEDRRLLNKKVISDFEIRPIKDLQNVKIKVDFCYKNGIWNYMQGVPSVKGPSRNTEWLAKTKFMFENLETERKVHLLYRKSDIIDKDFKSMLEYLSDIDDKVVKLDIENNVEINQLFTTIAKEAHDIEELQIS